MMIKSNTLSDTPGRQHTTMNSTVRRRPIRYILPTIAWLSLLEVIAREAPAGSTIEVHTEEMRALAERLLAENNRDDVQLVFLDDPKQSTPTDYVA
jgi:hypothetical protein